MADDVTVHNGAAGDGAEFDVATDDDGSGNHIQVVKLAQSANGTRTPIDADAGGLLVNLGSNNDVSLNAGTNTIGRVRTASIVSQAQNSSGLTTASTAYSSGDVLGAGWTFTSMATSSGGGGRIVGATLLDKAAVISSVDLVIATGSITFGSDNAAISVSDSDAEKILQTISLVGLSYTNNRVATAGSLLVPYLCDATSLYVYAVTRAAHTFFGAVTDLRLNLQYAVDP